MMRLFGRKEAREDARPEYMFPSSEPLIAIVGARHPGADLAPIQFAVEVAARWHAGQKRRSGDPYVTHPVAVATVVAELGFSPTAVCAALLHDLVDDTPYTFEQMRAEFGGEVTMLVEGLSTGQVSHRAISAAAAWECDKSEPVLEVELLVVKLADRLHNMRTMRHVPAAKQIRASRDTLVYAVPLAHRLGLADVKRELEDLAIGVLRPATVSDGPTLVSLRMLQLTGLLLPRQERARWREEWAAEVGALRTSRERVRFVMQTLAGVPRLAVTLNRPARPEDGPLWTVSLARIARALGIGGAIVAFTAQGEVFAWIAGAFALGALGLFGALLFARSDAPSSRLAELIRAWRR